MQVGEDAPAFSLLDDQGQQVSLDDCRGHRVVLYFYPKDMTSGCTQESCEFRDLFPRFKKKGVLIFGVSKDSVASHQKFKAKYDLPFPLLSDPDAEVCQAYGVWKEKSMYGRKYMGIERTTVVIGPDGKILMVFPKVRVADHAQAVYESLA
ncbi:MAG: thioredoxin-dependent thiol peroxidase [Bdellovibrionia bacterium]